MKRSILSIAILAIAASGCSNSVLEGVAKVPMTVADHRDRTRKFWVTLVDKRTGERIEELRTGGRNCRRGLTTFHRGDTIMVSFRVYRDDRTGKRTRLIDRIDLDDRFC